MDLSYLPSPTMDDEEQPPALSLPLDLSRPARVDLLRPAGACLEERALRGRLFPSWEEFTSYFEAWCERKEAVYYVRDFIPLTKCEWTAELMSPEAIAALRYSYIRLNCREGRRSKKSDKRKEKKRCTSSIAIRLNQRRDSLVVVEFKFVHNHVLCPVQFKHYFKKGQLLDHPLVVKSPPGSEPGRLPGSEPGRLPGSEPGRPPGGQPGRRPGRPPGSKNTRSPGRPPGRPPGRLLSKAIRLPSLAMHNPSQTGHYTPQTGHDPSQDMHHPSQLGHHPSHAGHDPSQAGHDPSQAMHPFSQAMHHPSRVMRRSTQAVRKSSQGMRRNALVVRRNARVMLATKKISKQFLGNHDIRCLLSSCKNRDLGIQETLKALDSLFAGDPASKVKVIFVKNHAIIQTVFFQTSLMRSLCQRFPETLIFDRMMGFNEEFALYTLLCVDANSRGRECAFCLARKGTPDLLRFTLLSLVQSIPEVKSNVRRVTVGVRVTEPGVVQEFMPNAHVQICRLEVLGALLNKIQEIGSAQNEKSWPLLCDLASSSSSEAYDQTLERMEVSFSRDFMRYFQEHWHPCRKMWVACWRPETQQGTSMLIRQHQQKLVSGLSPSPTLGQCILELVAMQAPKVDLESLNGEEVAACYRSVCNPEPARLIEGELGVAGNSSYSIQGTEEGYTLGDGVFKFLLDQKLTTCSCLFHKSSLLPCRHLFVIRFRTGETLFDVNLLQKNSLIKTLQK